MEQLTDRVAPQMDAYRDGTARALTGIVGVYGTDWTDPEPEPEPAGQLTETEAETLAVMLTSATRKMARVKTGAPMGSRDYYAWPVPYEAIRDLSEGFYEIAPLHVYGVCI